MEDKSYLDQSIKSHGRRQNVVMSVGNLKMKANRIKHVKDILTQKQDYNRLEIQFQRKIDKDKTNHQIKNQLGPDNLANLNAMINQLQSEKHQKLKKLELIKKQGNMLAMDESQLNFCKNKKSDLQHSEYLQRKANEAENEIENQTQQQLQMKFNIQKYNQDIKVIVQRNIEIKQLQQTFVDQIANIQQDITRISLDREQIQTKICYMNKFIEDEGQENFKIIDDMKAKYNLNVQQTSKIAQEASVVEQKIIELSQQENDQQKILKRTQNLTVQMRQNQTKLIDTLPILDFFEDLHYKFFDIESGEVIMDLEKTEQDEQQQDPIFMNNDNYVNSRNFDVNSQNQNRVQNSVQTSEQTNDFVNSKRKSQMIPELDNRNSMKTYIVKKTNLIPVQDNESEKSMKKSETISKSKLKSKNQGDILNTQEEEELKKRILQFSSEYDVKSMIDQMVNVYNQKTLNKISLDSKHNDLQIQKLEKNMELKKLNEHHESLIQIFKILNKDVDFYHFKENEKILEYDKEFEQKLDCTKGLSTNIQQIQIEKENNDGIQYQQKLERNTHVYINTYLFVNQMLVKSINYLKKVLDIQRQSDQQISNVQSELDNDLDLCSELLSQNQEKTFTVFRNHSEIENKHQIMKYLNRYYISQNDQKVGSSKDSKVGFKECLIIKQLLTLFPENKLECENIVQLFKSDIQTMFFGDSEVISEFIKNMFVIFENNFNLQLNEEKNQKVQFFYYFILSNYQKTREEFVKGFMNTFENMVEMQTSIFRYLGEMKKVLSHYQQKTVDTFMNEEQFMKFQKQIGDGQNSVTFSAMESYQDLSDLKIEQQEQDHLNSKYIQIQQRNDTKKNLKPLDKILNNFKGQIRNKMSKKNIGSSDRVDPLKSNRSYQSQTNNQFLHQSNASFNNKKVNTHSRNNSTGFRFHEHKKKETSSIINREQIEEMEAFRELQLQKEKKQRELNDKLISKKQNCRSEKFSPYWDEVKSFREQISDFQQKTRKLDIMKQQNEQYKIQKIKYTDYTQRMKDLMTSKQHIMKSQKPQQNQTAQTPFFQKPDKQLQKARSIDKLNMIKQAIQSHMKSEILQVKTMEIENKQEQNDELAREKVNTRQEEREMERIRKKKQIKIYGYQSQSVSDLRQYCKVKDNIDVEFYLNPKMMRVLNHRIQAKEKEEQQEKQLQKQPNTKIKFSPYDTIAQFREFVDKEKVQKHMEQQKKYLDKKSGQQDILLPSLCK